MLRVCEEGLEFSRLIISLHKEDLSPATYLLEGATYDTLVEAASGPASDDLQWIGGEIGDWQYYVFVGSDSVELSVAFHSNIYTPGFQLGEVYSFEQMYPVVTGGLVQWFRPDCSTSPELQERMRQNAAHGLRWDDGIVFV